MMQKRRRAARCTNKMVMCVILILIVLNNGCASLTWRLDDEQKGHPFIGMRQDASGIMCAWGDVFDDENEIPWYFGILIAPVSSFVFFTDMLLSMCVDLGYLPKDLIDEPTKLPSKTCAPFNPKSRLNKN